MGDGTKRGRPTRSATRASKRVTVNLTPVERDWLKGHADAEGMSLSGYLRHAAILLAGAPGEGSVYRTGWLRGMLDASEMTDDPWLADQIREAATRCVCPDGVTLDYRCPVHAPRKVEEPWKRQ